MTDRHLDAYEDEAPPVPRGSRFRGVANGLGAMVSIGLVAGMAFWGWKLAVRDVSGVPVVRAIGGPMRVAPDNPGGMQAAYQGLSVNAVAAEGIAAPLPDRIQLAPAQLPLDVDDNAVDARFALVQPHLGAPLEAVLRRGSEAPEAAPVRAVAGVESTRTENGVETGEVIEMAEPSENGGARSLMPRPRPGSDLVAEAAAQAALSALAPEADVDFDPATLAPGMRLVQLGAFDAEAEARNEWDRLAGRFAALMDGKRRVIQNAESGGRTFYRLRAEGFTDEADARRFCAALLAEQAACIPVLIR